MASTSYQSRNETTEIGYFRNNKVSIPTGNAGIISSGATSYPVVKKEALHDTGVGKASPREPQVSIDSGNTEAN